MKPKPVEITIQSLTDAPHAVLKEWLRLMSGRFTGNDGSTYSFEVKQIELNTIRRSETLPPLRDRKAEES